MEKRIVVGMSGGVDSSMTLLLLKQSGWQPLGVTLMLEKWGEGCRENACCTAESLRVAKSVCEKLGVKHFVVDAKADFKREVMDYFIDELSRARTPNPCITCNRRLKFAKLFEWAQANGIDYVATGHYAKTAKRADGKTVLVPPKDRVKDQTYGLCLLPQEWLARCVFPLGGYTKEEVYATAKREGFEFFLKTKQSQDLCFVESAAVPAFLEEKLGRRGGEIVDANGKVLGRHDGLHFFTIGQRRGLGIEGENYVVGFDAEKNRLIVSKDRKDLLKRTVLVTGFNYSTGEQPTEPMKVTAQVRYRQEPTAAIMHPAVGGVVKAVFKEPAESVTQGQVCACYGDGGACIGGGFIESAR
ncbi:tRNA 2-thiouridine(34) synthase MnmA [Candidatus Micrarchaeota archaeon CG1_02_60_51]|nr:MAG: tRNA 2-thiouridine(34) synthase MnmA [Candidatus Micrarchaeota archaeon CG1_02_60_51]